MKLQSSDFFLVRFADRLPGVMKLLGDFETDLLRDRLAGIELDRPVFITGLARSGTTILLNTFSKLPYVGTHRYRDFPFLFFPYFWNRFQSRIAKPEQPVERAQRDRIRITRDSPEAFEEPIWTHFFPHIHDENACHQLTAADDQPKFDAFYSEHLRKLLLLRGGERYVSKGNYNVTRIAYIANLLPDARFVVPVRHPVAQVDSLLRQHKLFTRYSEQDKRVPAYMRAAGHYEFGPQRVPINLDEVQSRRIAEAWANGDDALGYAAMWRSVYSHVGELARDHAGPGARIRIVRYEDLCADPVRILRQLFEFCGFTGGVEEMLRAPPEISAPSRRPDGLTAAEAERVWLETGDLAGSFGYQRTRFGQRTYAAAG
ncbi:MAG: sulfotransferase [Steroidobacteraceae bacterium]